MPEKKWYFVKPNADAVYTAAIWAATVEYKKGVTILFDEIGVMVAGVFEPNIVVDKV